MPLAREHDKHEFQESLEAATIIAARVPVQLVGTSLPLVAPAGTNSVRPWGMTGVAGATTGENVTVYDEHNIKKGIAGASLGVHQELIVGSSNGCLMPALAASLFSASGHWVVGVSKSAAAAGGEVISVYIKPRKAT